MGEIVGFKEKMRKSCVPVNNVEGKPSNHYVLALEKKE